jgi:hypothetical protein
MVVAAEIGCIVSGLRTEVYPYARSAGGFPSCIYVSPSSPCQGEEGGLHLRSPGEGRSMSIGTNLERRALQNSLPLDGGGQGGGEEGADVGEQRR